MINIKNIKLDIEKDNIDNLLLKVSKLLRIDKKSIFDYEIIKKSLDARKKDIFYVYSIDISVEDEDKYINNLNIFKSTSHEYKLPVLGDKLLKERPIIIGSGPSGLFCAYILSLKGFKPIIIERGDKIEDRVKVVDKFFNDNILDINSNVQFGEGGAGTFSDGKLNTMIKDKENRINFVLKTFVECGAPSEIMYLNRPHIGTDILRKVIINLRNKLISLGAEFRYRTTLTNINISNNKLESIELNNKEIIKCSNLFLCIGNSSRDTFDMLKKNNINIINKPFAVGVRISHPQELINKAMYKDKKDILSPAYYKLTYTSHNNRGVYSFCMCPGGYVINASSEENRLVINGMSNYKRDTDTANSAIIVTVNNNDYNDSIEFQKDLESKAYKLGNGKIPIQRYIDFKNNIKSTSISNFINTKGDYELTNLNEILPKYIRDDLIEGIEYFSTQIEGFNSEDAILYGVETRSSSPIRIVRSDNGISNIEGIYPTGEGSGYSGGITSSAVDGIKQAEWFCERYKI